MTTDELIGEVAAHAGLARDEARRALAAVLEALAARLGRPEAEAVADGLPAGVAAPLRDGVYTGDFDLEELYARVGRLEGVRPGFAVEHTLAVCQVLAEALPPEALGRLGRALSPELFALFTPRDTTTPPEPRRAAPHRTTLAEGRPGSRRPLSEARPAPGQSQSVVAADNPHADTKLSSARGLTQEREGESLATGRPGSDRPLSEKR